MTDHVDLPLPAPVPEGEPKPRRTMEEDRLIQSRALALGRCSFLPASWDKRFAQDVAAQVWTGKAFSDAQVAWITWLCWKYRRQVGKHAPAHDPGKPA